MNQRFTIVGIGEGLFDIFPDGQKLGGAPLNVAVHAHQLAQVRSGRAVIVTRVGQDDLGTQLLDELRQRGLATEFIQSDPDRPTGAVYIDFDSQGQPQFDIAQNVAWDNLQYDPDMEDLAQRCDAVCFGSLAQRDAQSRNTTYRFLDAARRAVRLFDVNLRKDFFDLQIMRRSCEMATIVKLNEHELPEVAKLLGLAGNEQRDADAADAQAQAIRKMFDLDMLVLTRGERGTRLYTETEQIDGEPAHYQPADQADAIGAGDACAAGVIVGKVLRLPLARIATLANHCGAFVASQPGATPVLPEQILEMVK